MSQFDPASFTAAHAADPNTPLEILATIANERPDLRAALASNPAAPSDLLNWLGSMGDPQVSQIIAQRGTGQAAPSPLGAPTPPPPAPTAPPAAPTPPPAAATPPPAAPTPPPAAATPPAPPVPGDPSLAAPGGYANPVGQDGYGAPTAPNAYGDPAAQGGYGNPVEGQYGNPASPDGYGSGAVPQGYADPNAQGAFGAPPAGGYGDPNGPGAGDIPPPERKSKAPLIIGLGVAGALVLGAGAYGAYSLWFSGPSGATTPVAAAETLLSGLDDGDLKAIVGSVSTTEVSYLGHLTAAVTDHFEDNDDLNDLQASVEPDELVDVFDLTATDLNFTEESLVSDETSRVTLNDGKITVDVDADKLVDIAKRISEAAGEASSLYAGSLGMAGGVMPQEFTAADEEELRKSIEETFPATLTVDDGVISGQTASDSSPTSQAGSTPLSVVTVKEGGKWFVSPLLTFADYALITSDVSERGSIKAATEVKGAKSHEAAGEAFFAAVGSLLNDRTIDPLIDTLPLAERRLIAFLSPVIDKDVVSQALTEAPPVDLSNVTFDTRSNSDGLARLELKTLDIKVTVQGASVEASWANGCITSPMLAQFASKDSLCFSDPELQGLTKLGLDDLSLLALQEDGGWFTSIPVTFFDAVGVIGSHVAELAKSGELNDWESFMSENFSGIESLFGGLGGSQFGGEDTLDDWGLGDDLSDFGLDTDDSTGTDTTSPLDDLDTDADTNSRPAGSLESELSSAASALDQYLAANPDAIWPMMSDLGAHGYTEADSVYMYVMDFQPGSSYCIGGYTMADLASMESGSLDHTGQYFADSMTCGQD